MVVADRAARLHAGRRDAVDDEMMFDDVRGLRQSGVDRRLVADQFDEGDIVLELVVHARRAGLGRFLCRGNGGQRFVLDLDQFQRVLRLRRGLGNDEGDAVADPTDKAVGQHRVARRMHGGAAAALEAGIAGQVAVAGGLDVGCGQHREHARRSLGGFGVDRHDLGVGMRRAQHDAEGHAGIDHVVDKVALALHQFRIFKPRHALTDCEFTHGNLTCRFQESRT